MKKSELVCVLAFALIFIGSVFDQLNVKIYAMALEPATYMSSAEKTKDSILRDINDLLREITTFTEKKPNETNTRFCNHPYKSIDAAMRIQGKNILFVDKGEVIDGRTGKKTSVQSLFHGGPEWVQAAVYALNVAYLFKDNKVWIFYATYTGFYPPKIITNSNTLSHSPECAMQYYDSDIIYLVKNGYLYEFKQGSMYFVPGESKLRSPLYGLVCDAAISSKQELYFIVKWTVFTVLKYAEKGKKYHIKASNEFFNKGGN